MFQFGRVNEANEIEDEPVPHVEIDVGRAAKFISPTMVSKYWPWRLLTD